MISPLVSIIVAMSQIGVGPSRYVRVIDPKGIADSCGMGGLVTVLDTQLLEALDLSIAGSGKRRKGHKKRQMKIFKPVQ